MWMAIAAVSPYLHPWSDPMFWPAMLAVSFFIGSVADLRPYTIGSLLVAAGPLSTAASVVVVMGDPSLIPVALFTVVLFAMALSLSAFAGRSVRRRVGGLVRRRPWRERPLPVN